MHLAFIIRIIGAGHQWLILVILVIWETEIRVMI
jgi:hypothetical protein